MGKIFGGIVSLKILYGGHCAITWFEFNVLVLILDYNMGYFNGMSLLLLSTVLQLGNFNVYQYNFDILKCLRSIALKDKNDFTLILLIWHSSRG